MKVTLGLASVTLACVTDLRGLSACGLKKGDEHLAYTPHGVMTTAQVYKMAGAENELLNHIKSRKL